MSWQMVAGGADHAQMAALLKRFDDTTGVDAVFSVVALSWAIALLAMGYIGRIILSPGGRTRRSGNLSTQPATNAR
jgi:hypothetical protein